MGGKGGSRDRGALSLSSDSPLTAIRRDPEACEKLEATILQLRRDQKGRGQLDGARLGKGRPGGQNRLVTIPVTYRGPVALLCHVEHQFQTLP